MMAKEMFQEIGYKSSEETNFKNFYSNNNTTTFRISRNDVDIIQVGEDFSLTHQEIKALYRCVLEMEKSANRNMEKVRIETWKKGEDKDDTIK